jgi:phenylacetate-coenzyme A ligase PaaK-like adenylate-forming protein
MAFDLTLACAWDAWRIGKGSLDLIRQCQQERVDALVDSARIRSPYYRRLYAGVTAAALMHGRLPPVIKPELMAHFDEWVTDPTVMRADVEAFVADPICVGERFHDRYVVWSTSGTTGRPDIFLQDPAAMARYYALGLVRSLQILPLLDWRQLGALLKHGSRNALIAVGGSRFVGATETARLRQQHRWLSGSGRLFSALQPLPVLVAELNVFQPNRLGGYPSVLRLLADGQIAGRLHIHPSLISPSGESLSEVGRRQLERAFGCPVRMVYSASEFMGIGYACIAAVWHSLSLVVSYYGSYSCQR